MDIPGCLGQLTNPLLPDKKDVTPPEKRPVSLKSFPIPGSKKHLVSTPCNNDSSVTLSSRAAAVPPLPAFTFQPKPFKCATEQTNKQAPPVSAQHHNIGANGNETQSYQGADDPNVHVQQRHGVSDGPDAQAAFINRLYVSHAGAYAGFPIHQSDYQLVLFLAAYWFYWDHILIFDFLTSARFL